MRVTRTALLLGLFGTVFGVPALTQSAQAAPPTLNFCAAKKGGNYDFAAQQIAVQAKGVLAINVINTNGSLDILAKLDDGTCDVGIVQSDALPVYRDQNKASQLSIEVGDALYPELLHLVCNKSAGLSKITGLTKDMVVFIGENGSGSSVTWNSFMLADKNRYGVVQRVPKSGTSVINKVKMGGDNGTCLFYVAGLKTADMNQVNDVAKASGTLTLVPTNDSDLLKLKSPGKNGGPLYTESEIPSGTYPSGLQPASLFGSAVTTVAVTATLVGSSKFVESHDTDWDNLLKAVANAMPAINKRVAGS